MFKNILLKLLGILPADIKLNLLENRKRKRRSFTIQEWNELGKFIPAPAQVKQVAIENYSKEFNCKIFVETGTYEGETIYAMRNNFQEIYSIELAQQLWKDAVRRFRKYSHIKILFGDSGKVLKTLVPLLDKPTLFWLDGHYSMGNTAKGEKDCPIWEELDSILQSKIHNHVLMIDDARLFTGEGDYPSIDELKKYISDHRPNSKIIIDTDMICITPN